MASYTLTEAKLQFDLGDKIGSGGEGDVYKAVDRQLNSPIAVKKVPFLSTKKFEDYFEESKKLYLTTHHNVVDVNYACWDTDYVYLAMPFYANGSINGLINKRFLTSREIIRYSLQFLSGLNNIHSKGLIHFDVKPENILISDTNQALVSDFGLAQYFGHYGFAQNFGTTQVLAPPEYFSQMFHNIKFDIYQAGITMYLMCNGNLNFSDQISNARKKWSKSDDAYLVERLVRGDFPDRSYFLPHIPRQLRSVIQRALAVDPNDRYSSIIDILNDLSRIDKANDWRYITDFSSAEEWTYDKYNVKSLLNGSVWHITASKNGRNSSNFTKNISTLADKNSLLYDCLNTEW